MALAGCAAAQEATPTPDDFGSPFHSLAKAFGFATDVPPPPDFIQQSRPEAPPPEIPVFASPNEPSGTAKSATEVEAIDDDLELIGKRHDALLRGLSAGGQGARGRRSRKKRQIQAKAGPRHRPAAAIGLPPASPRC